MKNPFEHWKTSLAGLGITGATLFTLMQAGCGSTSWKGWLVAIAPAVLGIIAHDPGKKDSN